MNSINKLWAEMKRHNIYLQLTFLLETLSVLPTVYAQTTGPFVPISEPILNTPQPKSNIHMVLDDSTSMRHSDVYMLEHAYGEGDPVCKVDDRAVRWGERVREGRNV